MTLEPGQVVTAETDRGKHVTVLVQGVGADHPEFVMVFGWPRRWTLSGPRYDYEQDPRLYYVPKKEQA